MPLTNRVKELQRQAALPNARRPVHQHETRTLQLQGLGQQSGEPIELALATHERTLERS